MEKGTLPLFMTYKTSSLNADSAEGNSPTYWQTSSKQDTQLRLSLIQHSPYSLIPLVRYRMLFPRSCTWLQHGQQGTSGKPVFTTCVQHISVVLAFGVSMYHTDNPHGMSSSLWGGVGHGKAVPLLLPSP